MFYYDHNKKAFKLTFEDLKLYRQLGVEPARPCGHWILSAAKCFLKLINFDLIRIRNHDFRHSHVSSLISSCKRASKTCFCHYHNRYIFSFISIKTKKFSRKIKFIISIVVIIY